MTVEVMVSVLTIVVASAVMVIVSAPAGDEVSAEALRRTLTPDGKMPAGMEDVVIIPLAV